MGQSACPGRFRWYTGACGDCHASWPPVTLPPNIGCLRWDSLENSDFQEIGLDSLEPESWKAILVTLKVGIPRW